MSHEDAVAVSNGLAFCVEALPRGHLPKEIDDETHLGEHLTSKGGFQTTETKRRVGVVCVVRHVEPVGGVRFGSEGMFAYVVGVRRFRRDGVTRICNTSSSWSMLRFKTFDGRVPSLDKRDHKNETPNFVEDAMTPTWNLVPRNNKSRTDPNDRLRSETSVRYFKNDRRLLE